MPRFLLLLGAVVLATASCTTTPGEAPTDGAIGERCASDAECTDAVCDPVSDTCVACTKNEHCSAERPVCAENACRTCVTDIECLAKAQSTSATQPKRYVFPTSCTTDYRCIAPTRRCTEGSGDVAASCAAILCPSPYHPICSAGMCACERS